MKTSKSKLLSSHQLFFPSNMFVSISKFLVITTILHPIFVIVIVVDSFQPNNVFLPLNRYQLVLATTKTKDAVMPSNGIFFFEKSKSWKTCFNKENENDLIRLNLSSSSLSSSLSASTSDDVESFSFLSLPEEPKTNGNTKKKKETKSTTTTPKQLVTPKRMINTMTTTTTTTKLKEKQSPRTWDDSYELLKQYKEEHGDCLVPRNYEQDKKLGIWVHDQRQQAKNGKLKPERNDKLDHISFSWDAKIDNWNSMLEELKEFQEEFGHCNVELHKYKSRQTLAYWVKTQRRSRPLLTNEQCSQLDALGFVWEDVRKARGDRQWEERFEALQDYHRIHGHTRVPFSASHNNVNLGSWVYTQRQNYRKGLLQKDREDKLNSISFIWKLKDVNSTDYNKMNKIWMKNLEQLKDFKTIHDHTNVPQRYEEDPKLGRWVDNQRKQYSLGTLKKTRQEMLESIGFEWNPQEKAFEEQWMDQYHDLVVFLDEHGHVDVPKSTHLNLYNWLLWQRTNFANNKLESDRKALLEKLGVDMNVGPGSGNNIQD